MKKKEAIIELASDITRIIISGDNPSLIATKEIVTLNLNNMLSVALDYHRPLTVSYILKKIYNHYKKVGALFATSPFHGAFIGNALKAITTRQNDVKLAFTQPDIWRLYTFQDQVTILQTILSLPNEARNILIKGLNKNNFPN